MEITQAKEGSKLLKKKTFPLVDITSDSTPPTRPPVVGCVGGACDSAEEHFDLGGGGKSLPPARARYPKKL